MPPQIDPNHESTRAGLTALGGILMAVGGVFTLIGLVDFFTAFGGMHPPTLFWCAFIGLPMLAIGGKLLFFGNAGRIVRYMSQEITPAGIDTFNYAVGETRDSIRDVAQAVSEGLRGDAASTQTRCPHCQHVNDTSAQYCSSCGQPLTGHKSCSHCGHQNAADARFCDQCGSAV